MRAAMVGGVGYMAGKSAARGSAPESEQQAPPPVAAEPPPPPPAPAPADDLVSKIQELKALMDEGVLTPDEFQAAKAQLLAG